MDLKKAKTIYKAFTEDLPVNEEWYQKRLEICNTCDKNSLNVPKEDLTFVDKLKEKTGMCVGENNSHCTACGCCIFQKCSQKTEVCGLKEIGKTPKWFALEVEDISGVVIKTNSKDIKVSVGGKEVLFDFGTSTEKTLSDEITVVGTNIAFIKHTVSCGCTHLDNVEQVDKNTLKLNVKISTLGFRPGLNEKTLTIYYFDKNSNEKSFTIRFRVIKL